MRTIRFFCDSITQNTTLADAQFRHLTKVLRLRQGDCCELVDGKGTLAKAVIKKIEKNLAVFTILDSQTFPNPQNRRIIIVPSIAKGERFDLLTAKCTELGVDAIAPTIYERTVKQTIQHHRLEMIAIESLKQCQRLFLPTIAQAMNLSQAIEKLKIDYPNAGFIFCSLSEGSTSIINFDAADNDCVVFIGPEGGLTDSEENMLKDINAQPVSLTETVLRIETAAIAAASILTIKRDA